MDGSIRGAANKTESSEDRILNCYLRLAESQLALKKHDGMLRDFEQAVHYHGSSMFLRHQSSLAAMRSRVQECIRDVEAIKTWRDHRLIDERDRRVPVKRESPTPNRGALNGWSESEERAAQSFSGTDASLGSKRRRVDVEGLTSVKEESAVPSVEFADGQQEHIKREHHAEVGLESESRNRKLPKMETHSPTSNDIHSLKVESPFPSHLKVESPGPGSNDNGVFVKAETPEADEQSRPDLQPMEIEYEDISAEVEARLRSNAERRRNRARADRKVTAKRKRDRTSTGSEGRGSLRESLGRAAKTARVGAPNGDQVGITT